MDARNQTKENILRKRKQKKRRRQINIPRLIFVLILFALFCSATLFIGTLIYSWGVQAYQDAVSMYQDYSERAETGAVSTKFDGYTNILILGLDEGADRSTINDPAAGHNADTILILSFENATGRVRFISIPRDTWIEFPSGGSGRVGNLYKVGGASLCVRQISDLLNISIHQYVTIDMKTFADLVDILGGIDIYVEENMDYDDPDGDLSIHIQQGYQHLTGQQVEGYLRYRGSSLGDFGRVQRQQRFVKAFYGKILQLETIPKLPSIADIFKNRIETSAEIFDSAHLANVLRHLSSEQPLTVMLPGSESDDGTIWYPNISEIDTRLRELFPDDEIKQNIEDEEDEN